MLSAQRCSSRCINSNARAVSLHPVRAAFGTLRHQPQPQLKQQRQQQQQQPPSAYSQEHGHLPAPSSSVTRRTLLSATVASLASASWLLLAAAVATTPVDQSIIHVSADGTGVPAGSKAFPSISDALAAADPGTRILISAGRYQEKLTITKPVALEAYPKGADVEVVWETQSPYEHTIECSSPGAAAEASGSGGGGADFDGTEVLIRGLRIRHYSKSVANNYGVFISAGSPVLDGCDISSSSGTGLGIEGACRPLLTACHVHSCASHGVAIFGPIVAGGDSAPCAGTQPRLRGCDIEGNKLDGVLLRSGASLDMEGCNVHGNGGFGLNVQDAGGSLRNNVLERNGRGAALVVPSFDLDLDLDSLRSTNRLLGDLLVK